jgi:DNA-directed RNA polymerase subunit F
MPFPYSVAENNFEQMCSKLRTRKNNKVFFCDRDGYAKFVVDGRKRRPKERVFDIDSDTLWEHMEKFTTLVQFGLKFRVRLADGKRVILRLHSAWRDRKDFFSEYFEAMVWLQIAKLRKVVENIAGEVAGLKTTVVAEIADVMTGIETTQRMVKRQELGYQPDTEELGLHHAQKYTRAKSGK